MREMFIVLAEQLEQEESKRAVAAERQKRYRLRHNNGDSDATVTQQSHNGDVTVTPLAPVENKTLSSLTTEKKEESKNPSIIPPSSKPENVSRDTVNALALIKGFEDFWAVYPKRAGGRDKPGAFKAFRAALKREPAEFIIAGAGRYASYVERADKSGTEFILQARTWLNRNSWEENYETSQHRPKLGSIAGSAAIIDAALAAEETAIREEEERQRFGETNVDELPRLRQVN